MSTLSSGRIIKESERRLKHNIEKAEDLENYCDSTSDVVIDFGVRESIPESKGFQRHGTKFRVNAKDLPRFILEPKLCLSRSNNSQEKSDIRIE